MSKYKLINDPVHGFISIPNQLVFQLIESQFFQRLRRISQMAMACYVYPGATHTRFHHALGAMFLMQKAIDTLRKKNVAITTEEEEASLCAILLHDIGHGPYSHALEYVMTEQINHEFFSELIIQKLNTELDGKLELCVQIFTNQYHKPFLHQLVSSQLDVDRLDYLARDSFFSGVTEGKISNERIISMLNVVDNRLVVEEKGKYSIEKYIISRHLMYWQVYLHKTVICAEQLLVKAIQRAKYLASTDQLTSDSRNLNHFLLHTWSKEDYQSNPEHLIAYSKLDDYDIMFSIKQWQHHPDRILSTLCQSIIQRNLPKIQLKSKSTSKKEVEEKRTYFQNKMGISNLESEYIVYDGSVENQAYKKGKNGIFILKNNGKIVEINSISDQIITESLTQSIKKYFLCYPKN